MLGLFAFMALSGSMWADTLNESCGVIGPQNTDFSGTNITCANFNVAGATLNSITITINGTDTGSITLTNNNPTDDTNTSGTISTNYSLTSALVGFSFSAPLFNISVGVGPATILADGGVLSNTNLTGSNSAGPLVDTNAGTFGNYSGAGTFNIPITTITQFLLSVTPQSNTGLTAVNSSDSVQATASVSFDYTPAGTGAPEPGTALFMGAGLVLCFVGARRRRQA
jgi:hypothetical protein